MVYSGPTAATHPHTHPHMIYLIFLFLCNTQPVFKINKTLLIIKYTTTTVLHVVITYYSIFIISDMISMVTPRILVVENDAR